MAANRRSFELFSLSGGIKGSPSKLDPASFVALGALELDDIERWIREDPTLVGEDLKVVTSQFAGFAGSSDRLDLLAIDRAGALVVIEIKRDSSGAYQDLQALRYAAFASTFRADQVVDAYAAYVKKTEQRQLDAEQSRAELEAFIQAPSLDVVDDEEQPRMILVAGGFQIGVTTTVLWLRRTAGLDITCVQLVPYEIGGELVLGSSILIPLPEAGDYEVKVAEKQIAATKNRAKLDHEKAREFIRLIPKGRWAAYGDVARAGGSPKGAMGVGSWLLSKGEEVLYVYRVLNAIGEVSNGWKAAGPHLPPDPAGVRTLLEEEGVVFDEEGRADQAQRWRVEDFKNHQAELAAIHDANRCGPEGFAGVA